MEVRRLVRREARYADEYEWDPYEAHIDDRAMKGVDAIVNLSGANIGKGRWTKERKKVLYDSRTVTTNVLADAIAQSDDPPSVFVSQSAVGIYGDRGDEIVDESSRFGPSDDFLASLAVGWESAAESAREAGIRVIHPRTGLVLSEDAALLDRLTPVFRAGIGGPIGSGRQWWSWIDIADVVNAMAFLIDSELSGPFNLVSPNPVRQKEFAKALGSALSRPSAVPVPSFAMRLALGGEKADGIGLSSTRAMPERLLSEGFEFSQPHLRGSLERIVG